MPANAGPPPPHPLHPRPQRRLPPPHPPLHPGKQCACISGAQRQQCRVGDIAADHICICIGTKSVLLHAEPLGVHAFAHMAKGQYSAANIWLLTSYSLLRPPTAPHPPPRRARRPLRPRPRRPVRHRRRHPHPLPGWRHTDAFAPGCGKGRTSCSGAQCALLVQRGCRLPRQPETNLRA
jgi:hypothetical protein